jgi:hypothetical protein
MIRRTAFEKLFDAFNLICNTTLVPTENTFLLKRGTYEAHLKSIYDHSTLMRSGESDAVLTLRVYSGSVEILLLIERWENLRFTIPLSEFKEWVRCEASIILLEMPVDRDRILSLQIRP